MNEGAGVTDIDRNIQFVNQALANMVNYSKEELKELKELKFDSCCICDHKEQCKKAQISKSTFVYILEF